MNVNALPDIRRDLNALTPEFAKLLPSHVKPEMFARVALTMIQTSPELLNADRNTLFAACLKCAADGLLPDGREAALVVYGGKVNYLPMVGGVRKRLLDGGEIASVQAECVYELDAFEFRRTLEGDTMVHTPAVFAADRGKLRGVYAIARFRDGRDPLIEVVGLEDIEKARSSSRSGTGPNSPWTKWYSRMAAKVAVHRIGDLIPTNPDTAAFLSRSKGATYEHEPEPVARLAAPPTQMPRVAAKALPTPRPATTPHRDPSPDWPEPPRAPEPPTTTQQALDDEIPDFDAAPTPPHDEDGVLLDDDAPGDPAEPGGHEDVQWIVRELVGIASEAKLAKFQRSAELKERLSGLLPDENRQVAIAMHAAMRRLAPKPEDAAAVTDAP